MGDSCVDSDNTPTVGDCCFARLPICVCMCMSKAISNLNHMKSFIMNAQKIKEELNFHVEFRLMVVKYLICHCQSVRPEDRDRLDIKYNIG